MRPLIKICGITNFIDAKNALNFGADYIGLNNISETKRYVSCAEIDEIVEQLSPEEIAKLVLLTDFDSADTLVSLSSKLGIANIQPYAKFSTKDLVNVKSLGFKIFYPVAVATSEDVKDLDSYKDAVDLLILDTKVPGELGGTGRSFDWDLFKEAKQETSIPLALAGGIRPQNLAKAVRDCNPYMLDVSSGLESKPRIKSVDLMREFFRELGQLQQQA